MPTKTSFVRPAVVAMQGYVPGEQPQGRRYIKLNTNENPYPPSPRVIEALRAAVTDDLRLYPDPEARALREKAAEMYGVPVEQILAGNGSDDLLSMLFRACTDAGSTSDVAYATPTYSLYDTLAAIQGTTPATVPYPADFALPIEALLAQRARLTIICNPNAPSGTVTPLATIEAFAKRAAGLVVVDEAYVDFRARHGSVALGHLPQRARASHVLEIVFAGRDARGARFREPRESCANCTRSKTRTTSTA